MKTLLLIILRLICLCCAMRYWQFYVGFNRAIYDVLSHAFVVCFLIWNPITDRTSGLDAKLKGYTLMLWMFGPVVALSAVPMVVNSASTLGWSQFYKNSLSLLSYNVFLVCLVRFLAVLRPERRRMFLHLYLYGVIASCLFEFAEVTLADFSGLDLTRLVFEPLSYNAPLFSDLSKPLYYEWAGFFRANGFAGTNVQGIYVGSALPFLFLKVASEKSAKWYLSLVIAITALLLTMSVSGILGAAVGCLVFTSFNYRRPLQTIAMLVVVGLPLWYLYSKFAVETSALAETRWRVDSSRLELYQKAIELSSENPAGIGFGQYYVLFAEAGDIGMDRNPHNNWLSVLVELGYLGLFYQLFFFGYILIALSRVRSNLGNATFGSICGLMVSACFNENVDVFFAGFLIALFFACSILDTPRNKATRNSKRSVSVALSRTAPDSSVP